MKILLIVQDDPFFLYDDIQVLLNNKEIKIVGAVVLNQKLPNDTLTKLISRYLNIFGLMGTLKLVNKAIYLKYFRGRFIENLLVKFKIKVLKTKNINKFSFINEVKKLDVDLIISIACPQKIGSGLLQCSKKGGINLHGGYLPDFPGVFTPFWNLLNGSNTAGCTVHWINAQFDSGEIISRLKFRINNKMSIMDIYSILSKKGIKLLINSVISIKLNNYKNIKNSYNKSSYNSFPTKIDLKLFKSKGYKSI